MSTDSTRGSLALSLRNIYETLAVSFPTVVEAFQGKITKEVCDQRLARWASRVVENAAMELDVVGREMLRPGETYLVMSNHQSHYDVPVLFQPTGPSFRTI